MDYELFENYKNMKYRSEVKEELDSVQRGLGEEPDLEQDDAIDNISLTVDYYYSKGYRDALLWVLWDLNDVCSCGCKSEGKRGD